MCYTDSFNKKKKGFAAERLPSEKKGRTQVNSQAICMNKQEKEE